MRKRIYIITFAAAMGNMHRIIYYKKIEIGIYKGSKRVNLQYCSKREKEKESNLGEEKIAAHFRSEFSVYFSDLCDTLCVLYVDISRARYKKKKLLFGYR